MRFARWLCYLLLVAAAVGADHEYVNVIVVPDGSGAARRSGK